MSAEYPPPILDERGTQEAIIDAGRLMAKKPRIPKRCVLCFFLDLLKERAAAGGLIPICKLPGEGEPVQVYATGQDQDSVAVVYPGLGGPFSAAVLEELIGLGAEHFIVCGGAGVLDGSIPAGGLMLPIQALRDEGTSYHYLPPDRFVEAHPVAVRALERTMAARGHHFIKTSTWTTDAVYRETLDIIARRRDEGCLTVEMEAASLFAVAEFRQVIIAAVLYAGDDVSGEKWKHRAWNQLAQVRAELLDLALDAVGRIEKGAS